MLMGNLDGVRQGFPNLHHPADACARPSFIYARQNGKNKAGRVTSSIKLMLFIFWVLSFPLEDSGHRYYNLFVAVFFDCLVFHLCKIKIVVNTMNISS